MALKKKTVKKVAKKSVKKTIKKPVEKSKEPAKKSDSPVNVTLLVPSYAYKGMTYFAGASIEVSAGKAEQLCKRGIAKLS